VRRQLLVESIRIDGQTQSRERINEETVTEYAEALQRQGYGGQAMQAPPGSRPGPVWPPVTAFFDGTDYWMADGFHRLLAVKRTGRKNIATDVKEGSREDAAWAACGANQTHGLRRTNADKRKSVEVALRLHPELSDGAVASHVGVSREFVLRVRHQTERQPVIGSQVERRVGLDGRVRNLPPPPRRPPEAQPVIGSQVERNAGGERGGDLPPPPRRTERRQVPPVAPGEGPVRTGSTGPVDSVGRRIPEHLLELWGRAQEVQDMLTALSRIRVAVRKAQDTKDPLFTAVPYSAALAHLDQAYDCVQVAKPYAVCAFCQGHGCKACGQRGLLGKFRWDTTVPKEHKEAVARIVEREQSACG
jgi:hypothetical protein